VQRLAIVGHDMRMIEQVTSRLTYGDAALRGASSGGHRRGGRLDLRAVQLD
jgi:hypothetical protein